jgi:hypothetical protein
VILSSFCLIAMAPTHHADEGPMSEEAQFRVKYGGTKGGLTRADGEQPEPSEEDVQAKGGLSKEAQVHCQCVMRHVMCWG